MTCRTLACLPALTGAYADPHGGALLSSGGAFGFDLTVFERPDLLPRPAPRVINMIQLGPRTDRSGAGAAGQGALRVQLQPGGGVSQPVAGAAGAGARGPVHRRARAGDDRHRALRGLRAAGHHVDGARGSLSLVRPVLPAARATRPAAARRGPLQLGGLRDARPRAGGGTRALREHAGRADPPVPGRGGTRRCAASPTSGSAPRARSA